MSDDLLPIPMWRVSVKILCTCCGMGLYRFDRRSESEGNFDEATEADIPEMLKQQMDWAEADGWEVDHENQTAICDICVRMPMDAQDRRMLHTRRSRVGLLGQGASTSHYDDWGYSGYNGYNTWGGSGCTISRSSSYKSPESKATAEFKDAAKEALARIDDHNRQQAIADGNENPPERHEEYDKVRDIMIDSSKAMDKLRSLNGAEQTKAAIETNALIKESKKEITKLIEALEKREAETDRVTAAVEDLSMMQVEIVDKHLTAPKAKKKKPKKRDKVETVIEEGTIFEVLDKPEGPTGPSAVFDISHEITKLAQDRPVAEKEIGPGDRVLVNSKNGEFDATVVAVIKDPKFPFYVKKTDGSYLAVSDKCVHLAATQEGD